MDWTTRCVDINERTNAVIGGWPYVLQLHLLGLLSIRFSYTAIDAPIPASRALPAQQQISDVVSWVVGVSLTRLTNILSDLSRDIE